MKQRMKCKELIQKIKTPAEAAAYIKKGMTLGVSGFANSGYTKKVAEVLSQRSLAGEELDLTIYSGANCGMEFDGLLARSGAVKKRMPFITDKDMRNHILNGDIHYVDLQLSVLPKWVQNGYLGKIDVALIEAIGIDEEGNIIPTTSVGMSETIVDCADLVIVEINTTVPMNLKGIHDIYMQEKAPNTKPIPLLRPDDRIGTPYIKCDPAKIVAIVESDIPDCGNKSGIIDDDYRRMSEHLIRFLEKEAELGHICTPLPPIQAGVGTVSDAVIEGFQNSGFEHLTVYSEVIQNSMLKLLKTGKIDSLSGCALCLSQEMMQEFFRNYEEQYKGKVVLRPMAISNSPEVIRRLSLISFNTVIEADIYGNVNSTFIDGSRLMNGVGGSGDFCQNAGLSVFMTKSTNKGINSCIVPIVSHLDHVSQNVHVIVTEQGLADLRGLDMRQRAECIIENCAHPDFKDELWQYLRKASILTDYPAFPFSVEANFMFKKNAGR